MVYKQFAHVYDQLMEDVPYDQWLDYLQRVISKYHINIQSIIDVGCGTGALVIPLSKKGYHMTGVDISEDMLIMAEEKARKQELFIHFFQQDMRELEGFEPTDMVTIFCDSLNYLVTEDDVKATFKSVYNNLRVGGLFLFDVHSVEKIQQVFINHTFTYQEDEISYIWECFEGEFDYSVEHDLTFFVKQVNGNLYEKFSEIHYQRTFPIPYYKSWLEDSGFEVLEITGDFSEDAPNNQTERVFFACIKK